MQFQVPQFLDVEDRVVGPLTIKQFLYATGGVAMGYMFWRFIPWTIVALVPAVGIVALGFTLAFYKYNNRPFIEIIESGFYFFVSDRLYVWKQLHKESVTEDVDLTRFKATRHVVGPGTQHHTGSRLNNLSWQIDLEPGQATAHETGFRT